MVVTRAHKVQKQPGAHGQYQWQYMEKQTCICILIFCKAPSKRHVHCAICIPEAHYGPVGHYHRHQCDQTTASGLHDAVPENHCLGWRI